MIKSLFEISSKNKDEYNDETISANKNSSVINYYTFKYILYILLSNPAADGKEVQPGHPEYFYF